MSSTGQFDDLLQQYLSRNRNLQRWSLALTIIPLTILVVLSLLASRKATEYARLVNEIRTKKTELENVNRQLEELKKKSQVQELAINIVKQQNPGTRPNVVVYRLAVAGQVDSALKVLGYNVDHRPQQGNPNLANKPVDTLSYGCGVNVQDIRTVATALGNAGIPIRRISPAEKNPDPNLVQVISSAFTSENQKPLTASEIATWQRPPNSKTCAGNSQH